MGDRWIDGLARRLAGGAKATKVGPPGAGAEPEAVRASDPDEPIDASRRRLLSRAGILGAAVATYVIPGWTPALAACRRGLTRCAGRCVNLKTSERHCGRCGHRCKRNQHCSKGKCCRKGLTNCRGKCTNLKTSEQNCGKCGNKCADGRYCSKGKCCPEGTVNCGGTCRNLKTSEAHCGSCGHACAAGQTCVNGACTDPAPDCATAADCGTDTECMSWLCEAGICAQSLVGDGQPCTGGTCQSGICEPDQVCVPDSSEACYSGPAGTEGVGVCQSGTRTCLSDGSAWGPCEGEVVPSPETCNGLDDDCDGAVDNGVTEPCYTGPPGTENVGVCQPGTRTCSGGVWGTCVGEVLPGPEVCNGLDDDCDGQVDDGFDLQSDEQNCGECGNVCVFDNATGQCVSGVCIATCNSGYADCDGNPSNGCETQLGTQAHCMACGDTCAIGEICCPDVGCWAGPGCP